MGQLTLISPTTAGGTQTVSTENYQYITFTASGLATTETCSVTVQLPDGQAAVPAMDVNGASGGLTATNKTRNYYGGPNYVVTQSVTAGSSGVYVDLGGRVD
jgi:hypothetical protein